MNALGDTKMSQNMELDAGDLVSRLRALVFTSPVMKGWPDWRPKADAAMTEAADFISRLSTAPAGDVVLVPRRIVARAIVILDVASREEGAASDIKATADALQMALSPDTAPTPSPQTSPATEGEVGLEIVQGETVSVDFSFPGVVRVTLDFAEGTRWGAGTVAVHRALSRTP